uniref:Transmembrane protein 159 n=1 Tax=Athene cunicularia TaxID=194338 RepID=A0A663M0Y6_ATHCN
ALIETPPVGLSPWLQPVQVSLVYLIVVFMNSHVGQHIGDHLFVVLSVLIFIAVPAIPVEFFLIFVATTAIMACIAVIVLEGVVIATGGIALLCVLCGLGALSLGVSGVLSVCYIFLSTLVNYNFTRIYNCLATSKLVFCRITNKLLYC